MKLAPQQRAEGSGWKARRAATIGIGQSAFGFFPDLGPVQLGPVSAEETVASTKLVSACRCVYQQGILKRASRG